MKGLALHVPSRDPTAVRELCEHSRRRSTGFTPLHVVCSCVTFGLPFKILPDMIRRPNKTSLVLRVCSDICLAADGVNVFWHLIHQWCEGPRFNLQVAHQCEAIDLRSRVGSERLEHSEDCTSAKPFVIAMNRCTKSRSTIGER